MTPDIHIRSLDRIQEYRAAQRIMAETWGGGTDEVAALPTLVAAALAGGLISGAFEGGALVGFTFAFPGRDAAGHYLHSQMTAVVGGRRGRGLGRALKFHQREWAIRNGWERMRWTFDPLMSGNARFNLRHLGAEADCYIVDLYGPLDSPLHGSLPTDRLLVEWRLLGERVGEAARGAGARWPCGPHSGIPLLYEREPGAEGTGPPRGVRALCPASEPLLLAPIPADFMELMRASGPAAASWREGTRTAFTAALAAGYRFVDLVDTCGGGGPHYLLAAAGQQWEPSGQ